MQYQYNHTYDITGFKRYMGAVLLGYFSMGRKDLYIEIFEIFGENSTDAFHSRQEICFNIAFAVTWRMATAASRMSDEYISSRMKCAANFMVHGNANTCGVFDVGVFDNLKHRSKRPPIILQYFLVHFCTYTFCTLSLTISYPKIFN